MSRRLWSSCFDLGTTCSHVDRFNDRNALLIDKILSPLISWFKLTTTETDNYLGFIAIIMKECLNITLASKYLSESGVYGESVQIQK